MLGKCCSPCYSTKIKTRRVGLCRYKYKVTKMVKCFWFGSWLRYFEATPIKLAQSEMQKRHIVVFLKLWSVIVAVLGDEVQSSSSPFGYYDFHFQPSPLHCCHDLRSGSGSKPRYISVYYVLHIYYCISVRVPCLDLALHLHEAM